jgi:hypothetical protein
MLTKVSALLADLDKVENMDYVGLELTMQNRVKVDFALKVSCGKQLNANTKLTAVSMSVSNCYK